MSAHNAPGSSLPDQRYNADYVPQNRCQHCEQHLVIGNMRAYLVELEQQVGQLRASLAENTRVFRLIAQDDGGK